MKDWDSEVPYSPQRNALFKSCAISKDSHSHKWMYGTGSPAQYLELAGLEKVSEREFLGSDIQGIEDVSDPEWVLEDAGICIESKKKVTKKATCLEELAAPRPMNVEKSSPDFAASSDFAIGVLPAAQVPPPE
jgi:hypothetical protein